MNTPHTVVTLALAGLGFLVACGGDGPGTEPNTRITVSGLVRERGGEPISGAKVVVAGANPVTTDADGRFSIPGVAVPYDLTVMLTSSTACVRVGFSLRDVRTAKRSPVHERPYAAHELRGLCEQAADDHRRRRFLQQQLRRRGPHRSIRAEHRR